MCQRCRILLPALPIQVDREQQTGIVHQQRIHSHDEWFSELIESRQMLAHHFSRHRKSERKSAIFSSCDEWLSTTATSTGAIHYLENEPNVKNGGQRFTIVQ